MPEEDPFDAAANEAFSEVSDVETVEQGSTAPEGAELDNPQATETVEPASQEVQPADAGASPPAAKQWWEDHIDDEIEYKGVKMRLGDTLAGGLRQADYTRKTQELAAKAQYAEFGEQLATELRADPVGALRRLAEQLRLIPQGQQQFDPAEEPDPAMAEIAQLRQQYDAEIESLKEARLVEEARREIAEVRGKFSDFSDDVLKFVAEYYDQTGVGLSIEDGYWLYKAKTLRESETRTAAARSKAEQEAATLAAARQASQVVGGHSTAATLTEEKDYSGLAGGDLFDAIANDVFGDLD